MLSRLLLGCALASCLALISGCTRTTPDEHLARAQANFADGEYRTAVIELKNALQQEPDRAEARHLLGRAHFVLGDFASAEKELERARNLGIEDDALLEELMISRLRLGRHAEVIEALGERSDLPAPLTSVLADAYLAAGDRARAKVLYTEAGGLATAHLGLATVAWLENDAALARAEIARALELDPASRDAWLRAGELELSYRNHAVAQAHFQRASELPGGEVSGRLGLARTHLVQGALEPAAAEIDIVLRLAPELFLAHYLNALVKFQQQDVSGAESALLEVQRRAPDYPPAQYLMGAVKFQQDRLNQATDHLRRYLAWRGDDPSAAKLLAAAYARQDDFPAAIATLQPYLADATDPQLLAMAGSAYLRNGEPALAATLLERAVEIAPDAARFRNQLALSLLSLGDSDRAVQELESAVSIDSNQFESDYLRTLLYLRSGDTEAAMSAIDSMIEKQPESPIGYNLKGAAQLARSDPAAARVAFEQALAIDPLFLPAAVNLARLDLAAGDGAAARARFERMLEVEPEHTGALLELANLEFSERRYEAAEAHMKQALDADGNSLRALVGLLRLYLVQDRLGDTGDLAERALALAPGNPDVRLLATELLLRRGDRAGARDQLDALQTIVDKAAAPSTALLLETAKLETRAGQNALARRNLERIVASGDAAASGADAQKLLARLEVQEGDVERAAERIAALRKSGADDSGVDLLEGDLALARGDIAAAMAVYRRLADADVRDGLIRYVEVQAREGETAAAIAALDGWLGRHADDTGAKLLRADLLLRVGDRRNALAQYEELVDADIPIALNNLAWLYMEANDARARETAERAYALAPANPEIADTYGWILVQSGEAARAVEVLRASLRLKPDNATVRYHLGVALLESGDRVGGASTLRAALESGAFPEAEDARARLAALGG